MDLHLTKNKTAVIDEVDADLSSRSWYASLNHKDGNHYAYSRDLGKRSDPRKIRSLHRMIIERVVGRALSKVDIVDHINGDSLDNRRCNLRLVSREQNAWNTKKVRAKTGHRGVVKDRNKFVVFCGIGSGPRYQGSYATAEEASKKYIDVVKERTKGFVYGD